MKKSMKSVNCVAGAALLVALAGQALAQIQHGTVNVVEIDGGNLPTSVNATRVGGFGPWTILSADRGDYTIDLTGGANANNGVFLVCAAQLERAEPSYVPTAPAGPAYFCTFSAGVDASNNFRLATSLAPNGAEANFNGSFVYFPVASNFVSGYVRNSAGTNGGPNNTITAPTFVQLRTAEAQFTGTGVELLDYTLGSFANGFYLLSMQGVDARRDGITLVVHAKDEDNRAQVRHDIDGRVTINTIDNGSESGGEQDPVSFVFLPEGTTGVTMGNFTGSANVLFKSGDFNVEMVGQTATNGTFRVTIPGESPATGTLIAVPHSELAGTSVDNATFVQADGDGWLLTTRDTEPESNGGLALQDLNSGDVIFHFAFFKNGATIMPGTPTQAYLPRLDDALAARIAVTELSAGNGNGENVADRTAGSDGLDIAGDNLGDWVINRLGARLAAYSDNSLDNLEGILIASSSQFIRDNSATGGISGWATMSTDNGQIHAHAASVTGGEINSNFAVAFIPATFSAVQDADVSALDGFLNVPITGNASTDGVMLAINWDNNNRVVRVTPNGSSYDLQAYICNDVAANGTCGLTTGSIACDSVELGWSYLPYTTPGLTAGQISDDGTTQSIVSGTGNFTIGAGTDTVGFPVTTITISGVDARADGGALLLNSTSGPFAMAWEAGPNGEYEVAGLDLLTQAPGRTSFSFAYIPAEGLGVPTGPVCDSIDFNNDASFFDPTDIDAFLSVFSEGPCIPDAATCNDIDFNNDGSLFDPCDIDSFLLVFSEGPCTVCGQ
jgi:hypothetical protein